MVRTELEKLCKEILQPLLRVDGASVELIDVAGAQVVLRVHGSAAFGPAAEYIQQDVIEKAVRKVVGDDVQIKIDKAFPKVIRRGSK